MNYNFFVYLKRNFLNAPIFPDTRKIAAGCEKAARGDFCIPFMFVSRL